MTRWDDVRSMDLDAARFEGACEVIEQLGTKQRLWRLQVRTGVETPIDFAFQMPDVEVLQRVLAGRRTGGRRSRSA